MNDPHPIVYRLSTLETDCPECTKRDIVATIPLLIVYRSRGADWHPEPNHSAQAAVYYHCQQCLHFWHGDPIAATKPKEPSCDSCSNEWTDEPKPRRDRPPTPL